MTPFGLSLARPEFAEGSKPFDKLRANGLESERIGI
jgi:hypothetical protein